MNKKKRRGVSYVMVVILVAFIFTTGSAMLTLVNVDYRTRIMKSEKVKNMYEADSGLNSVKNIIMKEANIAVLVANNVTMAKKIKGGETGYMYYEKNAFISSDAYKIINVYFKNSFISALTNAADGTKISSDDVTSDPNISPDLLSNNNLLYSISDLSYNDFKTRGDFTTDNAFNNYQTTDITNINSIGQGIKNNIYKNISLKSTGRNPEIKITKIEVNNPVPVSNTDPSKNTGDYCIKLTVKSTFQNDTSTKTVSNKKTVTTTYTIQAPEFQQALKAVAQEIDVNQYSFLRAITADGNVYVGEEGKTTTNLNVTGGIWAKGENVEKTSDILGLKYSKGIIVNNANMNVSGTGEGNKEENRLGDIYTNGSLSFIDHANVTVGNGSIYSKNVYMGIVGAVSSSTKNTLNAKNVITNNDLVMNSSNSTYTITNYYGINDVTKEEVSNGPAAIPSDLARKSSSLIVNSTKANNHTNIENAYINGVAYLSLANSNNTTNTTYETGESVAVNGNYSAYQDILPAYESDTKNKVTLSNYSGYDLLTGEASQKSKYFDYYYTNNKDGKTPDDGGVQITNLYAFGSTVNLQKTIDGKIVKTLNRNNIDDTALKSINSEKVNYAQKVLLMDNIIDPNENNSTTANANLSSVYDGYNVIRGVCGVKTDTNQYSPVVAFDNYKGKNPIVNSQGIIGTENLNYVFNNDSNINITIRPDGVYIGTERKIDAVKDDKGKYIIKAVIVTKGNVFLDSSENNGLTGINLCGSIISGGNVNISGDNINITYDESKVKFTIADELDFNHVLEDVYEKPISSEKAVAGTALVTATATVDTSIQRYGSSLLKETLWTLRVNKDGNS